ncbi:MAG: AAA family ATPase [Bacteroidota bacterium]
MTEKRRYIARDLYFQRVVPYIGKALVKVYTGQRRVGKSNLLFQSIDEIKKRSPQKQTIFIDKEDYAFDKIRDYDDSKPATIAGFF